MALGTARQGLRASRPSGVLTTVVPNVVHSAVLRRGTGSKRHPATEQGRETNGSETPYRLNYYTATQLSLRKFQVGIRNETKINQRGVREDGVSQETIKARLRLNLRRRPFIHS